MLLETYTTQSLEELQSKLPDFLNIVRNVTGDPAHSMYNLSLKDEWLNNKKFCYRLTGELFLCKEITSKLHSTMSVRLKCRSRDVLFLVLNSSIHQKEYE